VKRTENALLPPSDLSPELVELFTKGIPASIDGDRTHDRMLSGLLNSIDFELSVRYGKRAGLYREWLGLPNVTVSQAAWLLLGRDPFDMHGAEPESRAPDLTRQHLSVCNRLECEVAAGTLKPVGKAVAGFERRFQFIAIAQAAIRIGICEGAASQALMLAEEGGKLTTTSPVIAWQTERVNQRIAIHRKLIELIRSKHPDALISLVPKKSPNKNRRAKVEAINVQLTMRQVPYDAIFRELFYAGHGGHPGYHMTGLMLRQDRDQLNIKFKGGRPSKGAAESVEDEKTPTAEKVLAEKP
jgi:hypothetical protein